MDFLCHAPKYGLRGKVLLTVESSQNDGWLLAVASFGAMLLNSLRLAVRIAVEHSIHHQSLVMSLRQ